MSIAEGLRNRNDKRTRGQEIEIDHGKARHGFYKCSYDLFD